jgi:hypothetical protein
MEKQIRSIPRPLVKTNQWVIVLSVVISWISKSEWVLLIPFVSGLSGIILGYNPVMQIAKRFLKNPPGSYIPEDWEQQQFNQKIAVLCLGAGFISFAFGWNLAGYIFTVLVAVAAFVAILGFCIGCFILFQWKQLQYRRANS